jgi:hypothetical protein
MHPYQNYPDQSFWSRGVAKGWSAQEQVTGRMPLFLEGDSVMSAGSCFAANMIPYLEEAGFTYVRTEQRHPAFSGLDPDPLGYANFSAAYGNVYTSRQLLQLVKRGLGLFTPIEDRWACASGEIIDPFRPGLRYRARNNREFDLLREQHLRKMLEAFREATLFVFTFGLTEAWESVADGAVFPACPGTVAGKFDSERHQFQNFTVSQVVSDFAEFISLVRGINPRLRFVVTVSPVPLVATATDNHVLEATIYSKSVLRVAAAELAATIPGLAYFPAYEIITGPQAPKDFFEDDRRNVSKKGVAEVMQALLSLCEKTDAAPTLRGLTTPPPDAMSSLSAAIAQAECDEVMLDRR